MDSLALVPRRSAEAAERSSSARRLLLHLALFSTTGTALWSASGFLPAVGALPCRPGGHLTNGVGSNQFNGLDFDVEYI